ncbi:MAG TPA: serine/threonine-protein kinase [Blastocatellia bacterium]|nr:serine/threonine-protein kinase [Blastocatellia bacterium]
MFKTDDAIGPYTLIRPLGQGLFGVVWLAERRSANVTTQVAFKIPFDEETNIRLVKDETKLWVLTEARLWALASNHPNILPIIEAGIYNDHVVIISEFVPEGSLEDWLKSYSGVAPSIEETIKMGIDILAGLEHLHKYNIIHRDLKPSNLLLKNQTPRVSDFGISRLLKGLDQSSFILGTPAYMPPEAFEGMLNEQSDIWSVGVILHRMIAGLLPFPQRDIELLKKAISIQDPEPLSQLVPLKIQEVISKSLQKKLDARYRTAMEMRLELEVIEREIAGRHSIIVNEPTHPKGFVTVKEENPAKAKDQRTIEPPKPKEAPSPTDLREKPVPTGFFTSKVFSRTLFFEEESIRYNQILETLRFYRDHLNKEFQILTKQANIIFLLWIGCVALGFCILVTGLITMLIGKIAEGTATTISTILVYFIQRVFQQREDYFRKLLSKKRKHLEYGNEWLLAIQSIDAIEDAHERMAQQKQLVRVLTDKLRETRRKK